MEQQISGRLIGIVSLRYWTRGGQFKNHPVFYAHRCIPLLPVAIWMEFCHQSDPHLWGRASSSQDRLERVHFVFVFSIWCFVCIWQIHNDAAVHIPWQGSVVGVHSAHRAETFLFLAQLPQLFWVILYFSALSILKCDVRNAFCAISKAHWRRKRCEDRIQCSEKMNLSLHRFPPSWMYPEQSRAESCPLKRLGSGRRSQCGCIFRREKRTGWKRTRSSSFYALSFLAL